MAEGRHTEPTARRRTVDLASVDPAVYGEGHVYVGGFTQGPMPGPAYSGTRDAFVVQLMQLAPASRPTLAGSYPAGRMVPLSVGHSVAGGH